MTAELNIIEWWRACSCKSSPFIHEDDKRILTEHKESFYEYVTLEDYTESANFGDKEDSKFHLGILPGPYAGDLKKADIFILMLNPGLTCLDYKTMEDAAYKKAVINTLRQEDLNEEYPFINLNPEFAWTGGFNYWHGKLRGVIRKIAEKKSYQNYNEVLSFLAKRIACIQAVPYHSKSRPSSKIINSLPSATHIKEFVDQFVKPKAQKEEALVIVARGNQYWKLTETDHIIVYEGMEPLSASLSLEKPGGKAIIEHLSSKNLL